MENCCDTDIINPGEVVSEADKSKRGKKRSKASPWAKLLSQYPQVPLTFSYMLVCRRVESVGIS